jgi:hypothetical protein
MKVMNSRRFTRPACMRFPSLGKIKDTDFAAVNQWVRWAFLQPDSTIALHT